MKKLIMFACLVIVLVSSGCMQRRATGPIEIIDYHKGTSGLVMNFIKGLPPDEIWKENEFVIGLELRNLGAEDIKNSVVRITGFDPDYIEMMEKEKVITLAGKSPGYPEGDYMIMNFHGRNIYFAEGDEEEPVGFTASAEYEYSTYASQVMCINPDTFKISKTTDVCEVKPAVFSGGQGAPVAITQIEEIITPRDDDLKVEFIIYVSNKGNGEIIGDVFVDSARLSEQELKCNTEKFRLDGRKEKKIHCSAIVKKGVGARKVPLTASLSYKYKIILDKKIRIMGFVD
ncbi:hypothetical protein KY317_04205 [Candidatus Woesearchaeota archaeon]|nr:hypothetical protein [Candidatus Woesearchaeota archaeon]